MPMRSDFEITAAGVPRRRRFGTPITVSVALLALTTALLWMIGARLHQNHLIFIYFLPTALIAIRYGSISAMCVAIASTFVAAYFLYAPQFSFRVESPLETLELVLFSLLALLASQVVSGFANDSGVEKRRRRVRATPWHARWASVAALWKRVTL